MMTLDLDLREPRRGEGGVTRPVLPGVGKDTEGLPGQLGEGMYGGTSDLTGAARGTQNPQGTGAFHLAGPNSMALSPGFKGH